MCLMVSGEAFLVMPAKKKKLENVEKIVPGTCPLTSAFCASSSFCSKAYTESKERPYLPPLQKLVSGCQVHNGHLSGCLSIAPAAQIKQPNPEVAKILVLPGYNSNAKNWGGDKYPNYLVTSSWRFQTLVLKESQEVFQVHCIL